MRPVRGVKGGKDVAGERRWGYEGAVGEVVRVACSTMSHKGDEGSTRVFQLQEQRGILGLKGETKDVKPEELIFNPWPLPIVI